MAGRDNKSNLDYFELDCHMDEKVKLIRAEYGLKGFAVVVMMYQHIYGGDHGYYCEWNEERLLLFMSNNGLIGESKNLIDEIVQSCIRRDIFSEELFKKYSILTSRGVQKQYLKATAKRCKVELKKEYLLISVPKNRCNVVINSISDGRNPISDGKNLHSRVEKSREDNKNTLCKAEVDALFERIWKLYPVKKGKGSVSDAQKIKLFKIGYDEMARAIERYKRYVESVDYLHYKNGSTFFNSGYVDYLDANYQEGGGGNGRIGGNENTDPGQEPGIDFDEYEQKLFGK